MVSQITFGASPVIRLGLGLCLAASAIAFDMTLNTNVCLLCMSPVLLPMLNVRVYFSIQLAVYVLPYDGLPGRMSC